jgi:CRP-like cAMP-binding protein
MERFLVVFKSYKRMDAELANILRLNASPHSLKKHESLKTPEQNVDNLYFVEKGIFRLYGLYRNRQETIRFKKEDEFIMAVKPGHGRSLCDNIGIEALEDSLVWSFPGPFVEELSGKYHTFALQYMAMLQKEYESMSIAKRCSESDKVVLNYKSLCECSPELLRRVPIQYLAEYTRMPEKVFSHLHSSNTKLLMSIFRRKRLKK